DIEQLQLAVTRVALELDLDQPGQSQVPKQHLGRRNDVEVLDRFNKCTGPSELGWELARASGSDGRKRPSIAHQSPERQARLSATGQRLMDHDEVRIDQRTGGSIEIE